MQLSLLELVPRLFLQSEQVLEFSSQLLPGQFSWLSLVYFLPVPLFVLMGVDLVAIFFAAGGVAFLAAFTGACIFLGAGLAAFETGFFATGLAAGFLDFATAFAGAGLAAGFFAATLTAFFLTGIHSPFFNTLTLIAVLLTSISVPLTISGENTSFSAKISAQI